MAEYRIIACDLDGTLVGTDGRISGENYEAIRSLREKGIEFVPATGRAFGEMPTDLKECPDIRYIMYSNGSVIFDKATGKRRTFGIKHALLCRVLDLLGEYDTHILLHAEGDSHFDAAKDTDAYFAHCNMSEWWMNYVRGCNVRREDFAEYAYGLCEAEMACVFFDTLGHRAEAKERLQKMGLRVTSTAEYNLEIFSETCGKGNTLRVLAEMLGCDISQTVAVGDSLNDLSMIEAAGLGIAMSNAIDLLKEKADLVICSNDEHAAKYILEHVDSWDAVPHPAKGTF